MNGRRRGTGELLVLDRPHQGGERAPTTPRHVAWTERVDQAAHHLVRVAQVRAGAGQLLGPSSRCRPVRAGRPSAAFPVDPVGPARNTAMVRVAMWDRSERSEG